MSDRTIPNLIFWVESIPLFLQFIKVSSSLIEVYHCVNIVSEAIIQSHHKTMLIVFTKLNEKEKLDSQWLFTFNTEPGT